jgi:hypothetical protein
MYSASGENSVNSLFTAASTGSPPQLSRRSGSSAKLQNRRTNHRGERQRCHREIKLRVFPDRIRMSDRGWIRGCAD